MSEPRTVALSLPVFDDAEWHAMRAPLLDGWVTQGPRVAAFEAAFARRHAVKHALACSNGTTALHLILAAMGIGPGDEVIVPSFTWVATANAVIYCGARPVFADVLRDSFNIDPADVRRKITPRTRAVLAVHLFGLCADMAGLAEACGGVPIVEDAACAAGGDFRGRPAGSLGVAAGFSFHPRKSITTGEGGMVTTDDDGLAARVASLRNHGASASEEERLGGPRPYLLPSFEVLGFNYRMTDLQGAIGLVQLGKLDAFVAERERWARFYAEELAGLPWLATPAASEGCRHAWQSYVCRVDEARAPRSRNGLMEFLKSRGVHTRPGTHAIHLLGFHSRSYGLKPDDLPVARDCDRYTMAIPLHNRMSAEDYRYVVDCLRAAG
jgi:perosamine synthetase